MDLIITILLLVSFILVVISVILTNKLINQFKEENKDLRFENEELNLQLNNAERRVVKYARRIKKIEDIIKLDKSKNEFAVNTVNSIIKELIRKEKWWKKYGKTLRAMKDYIR